MAQTAPPSDDSPSAWENLALLGGVSAALLSGGQHSIAVVGSGNSFLLVGMTLSPIWGWETHGMEMRL